MKNYYFPSEGKSVEANSHAEAKEKLSQGDTAEKKESGEKKDGGVSSKKKKKSSPTDN